VFRFLAKTKERFPHSRGFEGEVGGGIGGRLLRMCASG